MAEPSKDDQHPGEGCCVSCIQDEEYDIAYSMWPMCCCKSQLDSAALDKIEEDFNRQIKEAQNEAEERDH